MFFSYAKCLFLDIVVPITHHTMQTTYWPLTTNAIQCNIKKRSKSVLVITYFQYSVYRTISDNQVGTHLSKLHTQLLDFKLHEHFMLHTQSLEHRVHLTLPTQRNWAPYKTCPSHPSSVCQAWDPWFHLTGLSFSDIFPNDPQSNPCKW